MISHVHRRRFTRVDLRRTPQGLTLVEAMVGLAIGLFLTIVAIAILLGTKTAFTSQETLARLQEKARYVLETLANDLRMSGFRSCQAPRAPNPNVPPAIGMTNILVSSSDTRYDFANPIWATTETGSSWSPSMASAYASLGATQSLLVVKRPVGTAWTLTAETTHPAQPLTVTPTTQIKAGDILLAADCAGSVIFQATTDAAAGSIEHSVGGGSPPGNQSVDLPRQFAQDAAVWRMQARAYYLAPSARRIGATSLWVHRWPAYDGEIVLSELASNVEMFAIRVGLDTNGDSTADVFVLPSDVTDWSQAVSMKLELMLVGEMATAVSSDPVIFDGRSIPTTDKRQRVVMHTVVALRNRLP